jgi:hypothetical protein
MLFPKILIHVLLGAVGFGTSMQSANDVILMLKPSAIVESLPAGEYEAGLAPFALDLRNSLVSLGATDVVVPETLQSEALTLTFPPKTGPSAS